MRETRVLWNVTKLSHGCQLSELTERRLWHREKIIWRMKMSSMLLWKTLLPGGTGRQQRRQCDTRATLSHDRSHTVTIITFQCAMLFLAVSPDPSALSAARGVARVNNAMLQCKLLDYFWLVFWIRKEHIINVILLPTITLSRL